MANLENSSRFQGKTDQPHTSSASTQKHSTNALRNGPLVTPALSNAASHPLATDCHCVDRIRIQTLSANQADTQVCVSSEENTRRQYTGLRASIQRMGIAIVMALPIPAAGLVMVFKDYISASARWHGVALRDLLFISVMTITFSVVMKLQRLCDLTPQRNHTRSIRCGHRVVLGIVRNVRQLARNSRSDLKLVMKDVLHALYEVADRLNNDKQLTGVTQILMRAPMLCSYEGKSRQAHFNNYFRSRLSEFPVVTLTVEKLSPYDRFSYWLTQQVILRYRSRAKAHVGVCVLDVSTPESRSKLMAACQTELHRLEGSR